MATSLASGITEDQFGSVFCLLSDFCRFNNCNVDFGGAVDTAIPRHRVEDVMDTWVAEKGGSFNMDNFKLPELPSFVDDPPLEDPADFAQKCLSRKNIDDNHSEREPGCTEEKVEESDKLNEGKSASCESFGFSGIDKRNGIDQKVRRRRELSKMKKPARIEEFDDSVKRMRETLSRKSKSLVEMFPAQSSFGTFQSLSSVRVVEMIPEIEKVVKFQISRLPRGSLGVASWNYKTGEPAVVVVNPIQQGKPFPTLFWLTDRAIASYLSECEALGWVKKLEAFISAEPSLQAALIHDNINYIRRRASLLTGPLHCEFSKLGRDEIRGARHLSPLLTKGIGGIANFTFLRCLHMNYAYHLVEPRGTFTGRFLEKHLIELRSLREGIKNA